ncbi:hypothetical protein APHAL10511_008551 [Amanita phalloides]|nr:hypothetical protein APHAL10511_008551 [Amanita phalloides]
MDHHQTPWILPPPSQLHLHDNPALTLPPINNSYVKHEPMIPSKDVQPASPADDPMPSTSDFVKKLYKMLEDQSFHHVVSWGPHGDCFVVKDMNEFTKSILPRMFKHSNFASFVRQLNKYDFHKVKNTDDNQFGEHSWTFRHPDFHANRKEALENIKRKVPATRKANTPTSSSTTTRPLSPTHYSSSHQLHHHPYQSLSSQVHVETLENEIRRLREEGEDMRTRIRTLERNYETILLELVSFQRGMAQQDGIMQNLVSYFVNSESGKPKVTGSIPSSQQPPPSQRQASQNQQQQPSSQSTPSQPQPQPQPPASPKPHHSVPVYAPAPAPAPPPSSSSLLLASDPSQPDYSPFMPYHAAQRIMRRCPENTDVARATLLQMSEMSRRADDIGFTYDEAEAGTGAGAGASAGAGSSAGAGAGSSAGAVAAGVSTGPVLDSTHGGTTTTTTAARAGGTDETQPRSGMSGSAGSSAASARSVARREAGSARPSSRIWRAAANAGLLNLGIGDGGSAFTSGVAGPSGTSASGSGSWMGLQPQPQPPPPPSRLGGAWGSQADDEDCHAVMTHEGLQVYTVGHLIPRESLLDSGSWSADVIGTGAGMFADLERQRQHVAFSYPPYNGSDRGSADCEEEEEEVVRPSPNLGTDLGSEARTANQLTAAAAAAATRKLRVRRSTFVPGWAVPPRVLLVDDDAVTRKLSSKFLQVFGCTTDVAMDGVSAVNKMNLEKYDLVLMDIVMPKLDGVSATSIIRKFDCMTPIISMTSNSKPNEILKYFSSGMNDILPKPFTKQGLLDMLEKHLTHLRAIQQMSRVPRPLEMSVGGGGSRPRSSSSSSYAQGVASSTTEMQPFAESSRREDDDRINPIAGLGLTDEQYNLIVQDIVNAETFSGLGVDDAGRMGGAAPSGSNVMLDGMGLMNVAILGIGEKRGLEEPGDGREGKRSRFEVIE